MRVLALKPGHDGSVVFVDDGRLVFLLEAEKDSFPRFSPVTASLIQEALTLAPVPPDVVALGGWHKTVPGRYSSVGAGYFGQQGGDLADGRVFGHPVKLFSSTHERSHLFMATAMAPRAPLGECVVLVWEGVFGSFYHWRDSGRQITRYPVMVAPGARYAALFALANPDHRDDDTDDHNDYAGKLMALAAFGDATAAVGDDGAVVERLLAMNRLEDFYPFDKAAMAGTGLYNAGVNTPPLHRAARHLTDRIFEAFYEVARVRLPSSLPLVISGGCGLNCEWNRRWRECGLFSDVFVPPCANDSGSAIGTAADAMVSLGEPCRIDWSVYAGSDFVIDMSRIDGWTRRPLGLAELAAELEAGTIVAWVRGRYEIGPRALGHRSLLASPLLPDMADRLNAVKGRETYRPIAPICRSEELNIWFDSPAEDPYMLYFAKVRTDALRAVTHVDGTARVQSVRQDQEPVVHGLLTQFHGRTGYGVLCNTSLNYNGTGFINRLSDLLLYCEEKGIRHAVVNDAHYVFSADHDVSRRTRP